MCPQRGSEPPQGYSKRERLRKRREFLAVQRRGRVVQLHDMVALALPWPGRARVGITVSAKVGNAVQRNRVKRLLREAWRREKGAFPADVALVLVAKRHARCAHQHSLRRQMRQLARRLARA